MIADAPEITWSQSVEREARRRLHVRTTNWGRLVPTEIRQVPRWPDASVVVWRNDAPRLRATREYEEAA